MLASPLFSSIPANKFYPPRLVSGATLQRSRLVQSCLKGQGQEQYQFIFIQAQAGQGKTTTAIQLLQELATPYLWFQVGDEDSDPIVFLASILAGLQKNVPEFSSPIAESQLANGQTDGELVQVLNLILHDLDDCLDGGMVLVFDDVHLLEEAPHTMVLFEHLLATAPPALSMMILSRREVAVKSKRVRFGGSTLYLTNDELALTRDEGVELLALFLDKEVAAETRTQMLEQSSGWPMGLVLTAQNYLSSGETSHRASPTADSYFEDELLASLGAAEQAMVLRLALLDEISLDLAEVICPDTQVHEFLLTLTRQNFFLRLLDDKGTLFGFHHHFLAFLRTRCALELETCERVRIWNLAADVYVQKGMIGRAMSLLVKSMNVEGLEGLFKEYGHGMVARNRHVTLTSILMAIPESLLRQSGWLSFYFGLVVQLTEPDAALSYYQKSRLLFQQNKDCQGDLLAACNILYLYIIHSQRLPRAQAILPDEVQQLFKKAGTSLPELAQICTANYLALGFLFFYNDFKNARFYNEFAATIAAKNNLLTLQIESRIASGWIYILSGDYKSGCHVVEQNYPLICKRELGVESRVQLYMLQLDYLHHLGDYENFEYQKNEYFSRVGYDVLKTSFVYPFLVLWQIELLFSQGALAKVSELIDSHILTDQFRGLGNYRGEMLAWRVVCVACGQMEPDVKGDVAEINLWLDGGASPLHIIKAMLLLGNMHRLQDRADEAVQYLSKAIVVAEKYSMERLLGCGLLHRAKAYFDSGNEPRGLADLQSGLKLFKDKLGCCHIFALTPDMLWAVLQKGVSRQVEPLFCQQYSRTRLQLDMVGAKAVPLLSLQVLGGLRVALPEGERVGSASTFIKGQRRLLGLLLKSEIHEVSQSLVQAELWPDVADDKGRGRFDTLMARIRKVLAPIVKPQVVKDYLTVSKGVVALHHCQVDSYEFCRLVEQGLVHLKNGEFWQAGNCFYPALHLWKGPVALELLDVVDGGRFSDEPFRCLLEMALQWCPILAGIDRSDEAMRVCALAWQFNHENSKVARLLYTLYLQAGFTTKARQTMDEYDMALTQLGVADEKRCQLRAEIEDVLPQSG